MQSRRFMDKDFGTDDTNMEGFFFFLFVVAYYAKVMFRKVYGNLLVGWGYLPQVEEFNYQCLVQM